MTTAVFGAVLVATLLAALIALAVVANLKPRPKGAGTVAPTLFYGVAGGCFLLFYLDDGLAFPRSEQTIRELFHLPADVDIGNIHVGHKTPACYLDFAQYTASVQFTPDQFKRYMAFIRDRSVWHPVNPPHYQARLDRFQFVDNALAWQQLPEPGWTGKQQLVWRVANTDVRRGLAQCYVINRVDQSVSATADGKAEAYLVKSCDPRKYAKPPLGGGRVVAALDSDKQRLTMAVRFESKPDFCENRVTNWLGRALGLNERQ